MADIYRDKVKYEKVKTENDSNTFSREPAIEIDALRLKGNYKFTTGKDGDSVTSSVVIRTKVKIPKHSKLDGHEVMESVRVDSPLPNAGYLNYLK